MAKLKSGDGFNVDFSDMFEETSSPQKANITNTVNIPNIQNTDIPVVEPAQPKESVPTKKPTKPKEDPATPYTIYLLDENDRLFLQFSAQGKHMTMTDFLWKLIEKDMKKISSGSINVSDDAHRQFRNVNLTANTSIKATMKQRESLLEPAAKHRLKITRYIAYVVHQAMVDDNDWD